MTIAFTHCALQAEDLDRSIAFYQRYCAMEIVKEHGEGKKRVVWMASQTGTRGADAHFVLVILGGGQKRTREDGDMTHYGFGVSSREEVDEIAAKAKAEGCLLWEPCQYAPPTGYLCGVLDPTGYVVEFSFGQPLGPHAESA